MGGEFAHLDVPLLACTTACLGVFGTIPSQIVASKVHFHVHLMRRFLTFGGPSMAQRHSMLSTAIFD